MCLPVLELGSIISLININRIRRIFYDGQHGYIGLRREVYFRRWSIVTIDGIDGLSAKRQLDEISLRNLYFRIINAVALIYASASNFNESTRRFEDGARSEISIDADLSAR